MNKASILTLTLSSILSVSYLWASSLDQECDTNKKINKASPPLTEERKQKFSELLSKYKNSPKTPPRTSHSNFQEPIKYKNSEGRLVVTEG